MEKLLENVLDLWLSFCKKLQKFNGYGVAGEETAFIWKKHSDMIIYMYKRRHTHTHYIYTHTHTHILLNTLFSFIQNYYTFACIFKVIP